MDLKESFARFVAVRDVDPKQSCARFVAVRDLDPKQSYAGFVVVSDLDRRCASRSFAGVLLKLLDGIRMVGLFTLLLNDHSEVIQLFI